MVTTIDTAAVAARMAELRQGKAEWTTGQTFRPEQMIVDEAAVAKFAGQAASATPAQRRQVADRMESMVRSGQSAGGQTMATMTAVALALRAQA